MGSTDTLGSLMVLSAPAYALSSVQNETFEYEPVVIREILLKASALDSNAYDIESTWKAADLYCKAARYGSAEAMYRLGMLYAFGNGVEKSRNYAANLFGLASIKGHFEAQKMLETIEMSVIDTPPCVLSEAEPKRAPDLYYGDYNGTPEIDHYVNSLPKKSDGSSTSLTRLLIGIMWIESWFYPLLVQSLTLPFLPCLTKMHMV